MIRLVRVLEKDRDLLWNLNQKYLYEMTNYYDDPMDAGGNYSYGYFDAYFSDPKRISVLAGCTLTSTLLKERVRYSTQEG